MNTDPIVSRRTAVALIGSVVISVLAQRYLPENTNRIGDRNLSPLEEIAQNPLEEPNDGVIKIERRSEIESMPDEFRAEYSNIRLCSDSSVEGQQLFDEREIEEQFKYQSRIASFIGRKRCDALEHLKNDNRRKALFIIATHDPISTEASEGTFGVSGSIGAEPMYRRIAENYNARIVFVNEVSDITKIEGLEDIDGPTFIFGHGGTEKYLGNTICLGADPEGLESESDRNRFTLNRNNVNEIQCLSKVKGSIYILSCGSTIGGDSIAERISKVTGKTTFATSDIGATFYDLRPAEGTEINPYRLDAVERNNGRIRVFNGS